MSEALFTPVRFGALALRNRVVMAPMTRNRADPAGVPSPLAAIYYGVRADAGLIVTEGTQPSAAGQGYPRTPGLHTPGQVAGWRAVTDAVHEKGGTIVLQLMHCGRIAHAANRSVAVAPVAPSAIRAAGEIWTDQAGMQPFDAPCALDLSGIASVVGDYRQAAARAIAAGFDGVELHGTSGYLPMQFLTPNANQRTDDYGGSVANRCRFVTEVLGAMAEGAGGVERVGLRVSPGLTFNDMLDPDPAETYSHLAREAGRMGIAYLHVIRAPDGMRAHADFDPAALLKPLFGGPMIAAGGFDARSAEALVAEGGADAVAFGSAYIANPDLVTRIRTGAPFAKPDPATFYTPGEHGYTDYPTLGEAAA